MRANLRGTPNDPDEVIVRNIEEPLPQHYVVDFTELPEVSIRCHLTTVIPDTKIIRRVYRRVGVVGEGINAVAEYEIMKEEL